MPGLSLFGVVPEARSCEEAAIPLGICLCRNKTKLSMNGSKAVQAVDSVVSHINHLLKNHSHLCRKVQLDRILHAYEMSAGVPNATSSDEVLITIKTQPGTAKFEASVRLYDNCTSSVLGRISRTNLYGDTADCITDSKLRNYCYCIEQKG